MGGGGRQISLIYKRNLADWPDVACSFIDNGARLPNLKPPLTILHLDNCWVFCFEASPPELDKNLLCAPGSQSGIPLQEGGAPRKKSLKKMPRKPLLNAQIARMRYVHMKQFCRLCYVSPRAPIS